MQIALVSREVSPLGGGGIGQFVSAAARLLSQLGDVTIVTTSLNQRAYEQLLAAGDPGLPPGVSFAFVTEPTEDEAEQWISPLQLYSSRIYERLNELYPNGGPDLVEFPDYLGESFVTLQAAETLDPFLNRTKVCVRIHTTAELCAILNGYCDPHAGARAVHAMERFGLARADRLIWQGGDILDTYRRFYGRSALASPDRIRHPYAGETTRTGVASARSTDEPMRILYAGRLERRKGVQELVRAATSLRRTDFRLTLLGGDTPTGPLGVSVRDQLRLAIADDERIVLRDRVPAREVATAIRGHDLVVVPSKWECWPYAVLEALHLDRPVLATPVGGLVEMVQPGLSGWLTAGTGADAIRAGLDQALDTPIGAGAPALQAAALSDDTEILGAYNDLLAGAPRRRTSRRPSSRPPLVSAVVPYYRAARFVRATIESLLAQTYPRMEIVVVNDGSFEDDDWVLAELAASRPVTVVSQMNSGLGAARNLGVSQSRGRYVFPLDADNMAAPEFVARCVAILEARPEVPYVTAWSQYVDEHGVPLGAGYRPLSNQAALNEDLNVAGDAAAVLRRRLFDAGFHYSEELSSFEDWHLYRELQRAGHIGEVIPAQLLSYRVRRDSLTATVVHRHRDRLHAEIEARMQENAIRWTSSSG